MAACTCISQRNLEKNLSKNILILKGSPRINGDCAALADQVHLGAKAAGAEIDNYILHEMDIRPCDACNSC